MDKVYVLRFNDVSDGLTLVNKVEVYADFNKAKQIFEQEVKVYYENNDFTNYIVRKTDNEFIAVHKEEQYNNFIEILLTETNIIK